MRWPNQLLFAGLLVFLSAVSVHSNPLDDLNLVDPETDLPAPTNDAPKPPNLSLLGDGPSPANQDENSTNNTQDVVEAARQAFQAGKLEITLDHLRDAVAADPSLPAPQVLLAELHLQRGERKEALRLLELTAAIEDQHPQLYLSFAKIALSEGRWTDALHHFEKMAETPPPVSWSDAEKVELQATVFSGKATVAERRGNWDAAQVHLADWLKLQPQRPGLRSRWAKALLLAGREQQAYEQFDIAYRQDNQRNRPDAAMAAVYTRRGEFEKANRRFAKALQDHPGEGPLHFAFSMSLLFQGRNAEADLHAGKAQASGLNTTKLLMHRGMVKWAMGQYAAAEQYFQSALANASKSAPAKYYLILSMAAQDNDQKRQQALVAAREFAAANPRSPAGPAALGWAHFGLRDYESAHRALTPIAKHPSTLPDTLFLYGRSLSHVGKAQQAIDVAKQLSQQLDKPGVVLTRSAAVKWIEKTLSSP